MESLPTQMADRVDIQDLEIALRHRKGEKSKAVSPRMLYLCKADIDHAGMASGLQDRKESVRTRGKGAQLLQIL